MPLSARHYQSGGGSFVEGICIFFGIVSALVLVVLVVISITASIDYNRKCEGWLKNAANANTPKAALDRLNKALTFIEAKGWTEGSSHIFWETPQTRVDVWYENLKDAQTELENLPENIDPLTSSNVLMKLRETLQDDTGDSTTLVVPPNILFYPNHHRLMAFAWLIVLGAGALSFGGFAMARRRRTSYYGSSSSFTLVEVLTVLAIIALLGSIVVGSMM